MCIQNKDGAVPSCIEAQFGGPGAEEHGLCWDCANILNGRVNDLKELIGKLKMFVGVYKGRALDKRRALGLIRDAM